MGRAPNFYYQDPTASIGDSLVRAIFGDPVAAQKQRELQAIADERAAQTRLHNAQAIGQEGQNTAATGLPELIAKLAPPPQPAFNPIDTQSFIDGPPPAPDREAVFRDNIAPVIAAMAQMQGDKASTPETVGSLASFLGGDELARRGLIAQGHSPTADFALTPERADAIAQQGYDAKRDQAFGVANINRKSAFDVATVNNRDDIPVAQIQAAASRYGADTRASSSRYATDVKSAGSAPGFDAITAALPGARMTSGLRSAEHNREVGGVSNSTHLGLTPGVQGYDMDPIPGMTVEQAAQAVEQANGGKVRVIEARAHRATRPDGSLGGYHWHMALQNVGGTPGKAAKAPKPITAAQLTSLDEELKKYIPEGTVPLDQWNLLRSKVIQRFQQTGDPVGAVADTINDQASVSARNKAAHPPAPPSPSLTSRLLDAVNPLHAFETAFGRTGASQRPTPPPAATSGKPIPGAPTATNAKGERMQFDGQKWVPLR